MSQFINQFSLLLIAIPLAILIALLLQQKRTWLVRGLAAVLLLVAVVALPFVFPGGTRQEAAEVEAILAAAETPVLVEFYSNY